MITFVWICEFTYGNSLLIYNRANLLFTKLRLLYTNFQLKSFLWLIKYIHKTAGISWHINVSETFVFEENQREMCEYRSTYVALCLQIYIGQSRDLLYGTCMNVCVHTSLKNPINVKVIVSLKFLHWFWYKYKKTIPSPHTWKTDSCCRSDRGT